MKIQPHETRIEVLEARIAPAAVRAVTYTDVDGDVVHVSVSGVNQLGDLTGKLKFIGDAGGPQQLVSIDLTSPLFAGNSLDVTVQQQGVGDGFVKFGVLNAKGIDLGNVSIHGDVDVIVAGDASPAAPGIAALSLRTLGTGLSLANTFNDGYTSTITGGLGSLTMGGDLNHTHLAVVGGPTAGIDSVSVNNLIGGSKAFSGSITSTGPLGDTSVANMTGSGPNSGSISAPSIGNFTATGVLTGGGSPGSGSLIITGQAHNVTVGGLGGGATNSGSVLVGAMNDFSTTGALVGGSGDYSGALVDKGALGNVQLAGLIGAAGTGSGSISASKMGNFSAAGAVSGGSGPSSGSVLIKGAMGTASLGNLNGSSGPSSGLISAAGMVSLNAGTITGGTMPASGSVIVNGAIGNVNISSLVGGSKDNTGSIIVGGMGDFLSSGPIGGGGGVTSGSLVVHGNAGKITVANNQAVTGGAGKSSGSIQVDGSPQDIRVGNLVGGVGDFSGGIFIKGAAANITMYSGGIFGNSGISSGVVSVGGNLSLLSTTASVAGDVGAGSGQVHAAGQIGSVTVGLNLAGGSRDYTGSIRSETGIGSVTIGGNITSGSNGTGSGSISTNGNLGDVTIHGAVTGAAGRAVLITALGKNTAPAGGPPSPTIGSLTIDGAVTYLSALAGYDMTGKALNAGAQIDTIHLKSTVTGSNFVAGAVLGAAKSFGLTGNAAIPNGAGIISKIASVIIDGASVATATANDHFGIVAQEVDTVSVNGVAVTLTSGPDHDKGIMAGEATDFTVFEV